jgi:nucleoside-diphosphate-sugar epimerase
MVRYLVTGGAGFIGTHLVNKLLKFSNVVILDNLSTGCNINEKAEFIEGDIADNSVYEKIGKVDGIFHLAAMSKVLPSLGDPNMIDFCNKNNVNGTINVLKFASSFTPPIKVVYSASSTCYGMNDIPNRELQLPDCQSPYALTKYIGELYCALFSRLFNVPTVRLRYFMVFGPGEPSTGSYAIVTGIFNKNKNENKPLCIHGDGSQTRDFVHVDDVAEANVRAMKSNLEDNTLNVGTGTMTSIKELADIISKNQIFTEPRMHDLKHTLADCTEIERLLGWKPTISIKEYVRI